jgi:hypothetical protein
MHRPPAVRVIAAIAAVVVLLVALPAGTAAAGQFTLATCQADQMNFSTTAFGDFATRGMKITRACNPEGPGLRGLITANVVQAGAVPRGSVSIATINAPAGTSFTTLRWAGTARRRDCRYSLQLYADVPNAAPISIKNIRANQHCPHASRAQAAGYRSRTFNVTGATRIVQRVICQGGGGRKSCSARGANYIRTYQAEVGIADGQAPTATIATDTALTRGEWVNGVQPLNYDAEDNVGVRIAQALVGDQARNSDQRPCLLASPQGAFANGVPCPNGAGQINLDTGALPEGTQQLAVRAQDSAGNVGDSAPVTVRIDRTPPGRVDVGLGGGEGWRNDNNFSVSWTSPPEGDRAPVVAAMYKLCPAGGGACTQGEQDGGDISTFAIQAPAPGAWTLSVWRRDAAGNQTQDAASVPVTMRYDPEPPQLGFEPPAAGDPTLVSVQAADKVSGIADGTIEISAAGSDTWQTLDTKLDGDRLVARVDDASMPAGSYQLRATAHDQANNEASSTQRLDGQPMALTLPLRIRSALQAGIAGRRTVTRIVHRHGHRRRVRQRVAVLKPTAGVRFGTQAQIIGRLTNADGQGIPGAEIQVLSSSQTSPEQLVGVVTTDATGAYSYTATASSSRMLRFAYAGSPQILPAAGQVQMIVPAASSMKVNRRHVVNGHAVTFSGQVRSLPVPPAGKLIELQVWLSRRWQTFRTGRTDQAGRWAIRYRFKRTRGVQHFSFRVHLPAEAGYPFAAGASKSVRVRVRGR